jgi:hypothetical protein
VKRVLVCAIVAVCVAVPAAMQQSPQMPNPKELSGVPLPAPDVPAGSVSVRVVRGAFTNNVTNQPVEFTIDGKKQTKNTDADGRAVVSSLKPGTKLRAATVVDGERIESQEITIASQGFRVVLVGVDPEAVKRAAEDKALAEGPPVKGAVVFGPESRVIAELSDDRLNIFYVLEVLNTARTPIDTGGPLVIDLPHDSRSASLLQDSSFQATLTAGRITVIGPFAPGTTSVQVGFELPHDGPVAHFEQAFPAPLEQVTVLVAQTGGLDLQSPQVTKKQSGSDQGRNLLLGSGPPLPAGRPLALDISGLPYHATWPRNIALLLSACVLSAGLWAGFGPGSRRRVA